MGKHDASSGPRNRSSSRKAQRVAKPAFKAAANSEARTMVQWFRDCGAANPVIIERTGLTHDFVWRWASRDDTDTQPGRGPDPIITDRRAKQLAKVVCNVRFSSTHKIRHMVQNPKTGKDVSAECIRQALHRAGLISRRVLKGQILTAQQRLNRVAWCEEHVKSNFRDWVFSDEKWWVVGGVQGNERMWVLEEDPMPDELFVPTASHPLKVHIWGAISYDGRSSLHIHDGKIDSPVYCACLKDALLPVLYEKDYLALKPRSNYVFMQDGASCHTAKATYAWLEKHLPTRIKHHKKGEWPASSPDLNPIERLWSILQDRVIEKRAYNYDDLVKVVVDTWWELEQSTVRKLYDSMPTRIQKCINAEGGRFKV